jgi:hypothetical protein
MITTRFRPFPAVVRAAVIGCLIVLGLATLFAQHASAGMFTLVDDNSSVSFDTDSQQNSYDWKVDGVNQLSQQAFWFRVGNVAEKSLDSLLHPTEGTTDTNFDGNQDTLFVRYNGAGFDVEVRYTLDGGTIGSGASDMGEQIAIVSHSDTPLDFHFFQYSDFDINGTAAGDSAVFTNANSVRQFEGALRLTETVVTPVPNHREINFFPATLNKLNDGVATTLNDLPPIGTVFGVGDLTWAYQWDFSLAPRGTFQISKDKNLSAGRNVPEPATLALVMCSVGLLLAAGRRTR